MRALFLLFCCLPSLVLAKSPQEIFETASKSVVLIEHEKWTGDQAACFEARRRRLLGSRTERLFARLVAGWDGAAPGVRWGLEPYVERVRCPVLAIQGEDDEFFTVAQLDAIEELIPGRLERLRIPGAAHYPLHQARNDVLAASIRFIRAALGREKKGSDPIFQGV